MHLCQPNLSRCTETTAPAQRSRLPPSAESAAAGRAAAGVSGRSASRGGVCDAVHRGPATTRPAQFERHGWLRCPPLRLEDGAGSAVGRCCDDEHRCRARSSTSGATQLARRAHLPPLALTALLLLASVPSAGEALCPPHARVPSPALPLVCTCAHGHASPSSLVSRLLCIPSPPTDAQSWDNITEGQQQAPSGGGCWCGAAAALRTN